uniref:Uncharacterized protein n=1 Tax=Chelonoidis abingdonii TaxID=106734 RepID=A0A8C0G147_CHEAB
MISEHLGLRRLRRLHHPPHDHSLHRQRVRRAHQPLQDLVHGGRRGRIYQAQTAPGADRSPDPFLSPWAAAPACLVAVQHRAGVGPTSYCVPIPTLSPLLFATLPFYFPTLEAPLCCLAHVLSPTLSGSCNPHFLLCIPKWLLSPPPGCLSTNRGEILRAQKRWIP